MTAKKTKPKLTKITLLSRNCEAVLGRPEILWPPPHGIADVVFVAGKTFVYLGGTKYREATTMGITGFDFR